MALLEVKGVTKMFGALQALGGVDLSVQAGTFHGLIGPNGSGKSTLLKAIAGAHFPSTGTITFAGLDVTAALPFERARAGLSLKFQITAVLPELSVYDNVLLALQAGQSLWSLIRSKTRRAMHDKVLGALARFRLEGRADDLAGELSHGEQQWLGGAMAPAPFASTRRRRFRPIPAKAYWAFCGWPPSSSIFPCPRFCEIALCSCMDRPLARIRSSRRRARRVAC